MKQKNQIPKEQATIIPTGGKKSDPITEAKSLVSQLRRDGARFFSNGSSTYLVLGPDIMELDVTDLGTIELLLQPHGYLSADQEKSNTFWGVFLDAALASDTTLLQAFLWEQGDKGTCCDITWSVVGGIDAAKSAIMNVVERYGDKLVKRN